MEEEWKSIINYEDLYQISNFGRIKSLSRIINCNGYNKTIPERILKETINRNGYIDISISKNGKKSILRPHRLVGIYFISNPNNLDMINHIDGNRSNNHINNLEWVNRRENSCHRFLDKQTSSNYRGVSYIEKDKKWRSYINVNNKQLYLGRFNTKEEAYHSRIKYEEDNNIVNKYL